jgi:hypothetical protein
VGSPVAVVNEENFHGIATDLFNASSDPSAPFVSGGVVMQTSNQSAFAERPSEGRSGGLVKDQRGQQQDGREFTKASA